MGDTPEDLMLTEAQLRAVIERAARLSDQDAVSVAELRQIAEELDLRRTAVDRALAEVLAEPSAERKRRARVASFFRIPSADALREGRARALAVFTVASALITPGDLVSLTLLLVLPMAFLYEVVVRLWPSVGPSNGDPPSDSGSVAMAETALEHPKGTPDDRGRGPREPARTDRLQGRLAWDST